MSRSGYRSRTKHAEMRDSLARQVQGYVQASTVWAELDGDVIAFAVIPAAFVGIIPEGIEIWAHKAETKQQGLDTALVVAYYGEASESEMLSRLAAADGLGMDMWWLDHEEGWVEVLGSDDCKGGIRSE